MSTPAEAVLPEQLGITRALAETNDCELSRAIKRVTQVHACELNGLSTSTMSRSLEEMRAAKWHLVLAGLGLQVVAAGSKVVPAGSIVVDPHELSALESMALKYLEARRMERQRSDNA